MSSNVQGVKFTKASDDKANGKLYWFEGFVEGFECSKIDFCINAKGALVNGSKKFWNLSTTQRNALLTIACNTL